MASYPGPDCFKPIVRRRQGNGGIIESECSGLPRTTRQVIRSLRVLTMRDTTKDTTRDTMRDTMSSLMEVAREQQSQDRTRKDAVRYAHERLREKSLIVVLPPTVELCPYTFIDFAPLPAAYTVFPIILLALHVLYCFYFCEPSFC